MRENPAGQKAGFLYIYSLLNQKNIRMKRIVLITLVAFAFTSCYKRIADLTLVSNSNYDNSVEYVLVKRDVEGKSKLRKGDPMEAAIDDATGEYNGDHMRNVKIYVKSGGRKVKVIGDVYANKKHAESVVTSVDHTAKIEVGSNVTFKMGGVMYEGKVIGINENGAIVEFENAFKKMKKKEFEFSDLTVIEK